MTTTLRRYTAVLALASALAGPALAGSDKSECLAGAKPGGGFDLTCRLAANSLLATRMIAEPMTVTYMEGGVGAVAYNHVIGKRSKDPTLITAASTGSALLLAQGKFGHYDETAVRWLGAVAADYGVIAVDADSPYTSLKELVDAYAADPTAFPIGGGGAVGSQDWMKAALVARNAGEDPKKMRYVALEGGGAVLTALEGGHIKIGASEAAEFGKHHAAGKIRVIAVLAPERLPGELADVPTAREQGVDVDWVVWRGYYMGKDVPEADYQAWVGKLKALVETPEFAAERQARGLFPYAVIGEAFEAQVREDVARFKTIAAQAGL
jgi:putative tricarboxylic transport membrane protein